MLDPLSPCQLLFNLLVEPFGKSLDSGVSVRFRNLIEQRQRKIAVSKTVINHSQCIIGLLTYGRVGACRSTNPSISQEADYTLAMVTYGRVGACRSTFQVRFCLFVIGEGKCTFSCKKGAPVILKSCKNFHCLFKVLLHIETHSVLK